MTTTRVQRLLAAQETLAVVGLGYVGLPLAVAFSRRVPVIGYDLNADKVARYVAGTDPTDEVGDRAVAECTVDFTSQAPRLAEASFYVIAVPTPINLDKTPDLSPVISVSRAVGRYLRPGDIVVWSPPSP